MRLCVCGRKKYLDISLKKNNSDIMYPPSCRSKTLLWIMKEDINKIFCFHTMEVNGQKSYQHSLKYLSHIVWNDIFPIL